MIYRLNQVSISGAVMIDPLAEIQFINRPALGCLTMPPSRMTNRFDQVVTTWWMMVALSVALGCEPQIRVIRPSFATLRELADPPVPNAADRQTPTPVPGGWSIELESFDGPNRIERARRRVRQLETEAAIPDLRIQDIDSIATIRQGRFHDPGGTAAQKTLRKARGLKVGDSNPFADAILSAHIQSDRVVLDPLDLKQHVGFHSLQIGYYDEQFGTQFRIAAEDAARVLRADGEEAFFYHGQNMSMVTIGLFTDNDFVKQGVAGNSGSLISAYGPRIRALQKKYPFNLSNGRTLIEKVQGKSIGEQPSFLVRVY